MLIVSFDSATKHPAFSVINIKDIGPPETLWSFNSPNDSVSSSVLLPSLTEEAFSKLKIPLSELDLIAAGRGPGSFTGLRTGLAFAKGLSLGSGAPALGVPTLDALAADSRLSPGLALPVIDARHGELYASLYELPENHGSQIFSPPLPLTGVLVLKPSEFYQKIGEILRELNINRTLPEGPVRVLGADAKMLPQCPQASFAFEIRPLDPVRLALLGAFIHKAGGLKDNPPLPIYGRSPEIFKTWRPPARL
jgi:tRNA threonylcarbamoyl adenosine modification protein YeaZ